MITPMTCLNVVKRSGEDAKFIGELLSYVNEEIKGDGKI